jgi:hypothetical protein
MRRFFVFKITAPSKAERGWRLLSNLLGIALGLAVAELTWRATGRPSVTGLLGWLGRAFRSRASAS